MADKHAPRPGDIPMGPATGAKAAPKTGDIPGTQVGGKPSETGAAGSSVLGPPPQRLEPYSFLGGAGLGFLLALLLVATVVGERARILKYAVMAVLMLGTASGYLYFMQAGARAPSVVGGIGGGIGGAAATPALPAGGGSANPVEQTTRVREQLQNSLDAQGKALEAIEQSERR